MKSLLYICEEWPNPYKPTWDAQIQCLMDLDLDVTVLQCGRSRSPQHRAWRKGRAILGRVQRFGYPTGLKSAAWQILQLKFVLRMLLRSPYIGSVLRQSKPLKERMLDYLRLCALPKLQYDYVLVKNLNCANDYSWLPLLTRSRSTAVYYHGGAVSGVDPWYLKNKSLIFDNFGAFFTNTNYSKGELSAHGCSVSKIHAVPVGLNIDLLRSSRSAYRQDGKLRILSVSRLSEEKGVIYAILAVEQLVRGGFSNIELDIVGNGTEEERLRSYVLGQRLERWVRFHGHRSNTEVTGQFLPNADVVINTSFPTATWAETQCVVIQEAGLARVPAIASNCGGLPEVVLDGKTGLLAEPQSVDSVARAIRRMALMSSDDLSAMGAAAEDFARTRFDVRVVTQSLLELMQNQQQNSERRILDVTVAESPGQ